MGCFKVRNRRSSRVPIFWFGILVLFFSCIGTKNRPDKSANYVLAVNKNNLSFQVIDTSNKVIVPGHALTGILLNDEPVAVIEVLSKNRYRVNTKNKVEAEVSFQLQDALLQVEISPKTTESIHISLQTAGVEVAHGLGDAGAYREHFNFVKNKNTTYNIINNGGSQRWVSSFVICPENNFAGVFFDAGAKKVTLDEASYQMKVHKSGKATFYYMLGTPKEIYNNYKQLRNKLGYDDVKPKSRLFELGWESWDALGWNTNQKTVKNILTQFHQEGYPIKWAVTGSGFWEEGGTTTSFGKWGEKFNQAKEFKNWMHQNDIYWMIGLRTNFVPEGGPYYPKTKKRDKNLKVKSFKGNALSKEALNKGYLVKRENDSVLKITSGIFPIVPSYLLDGRKKEAAEWFANKYSLWGVDGIKEDTMMKLNVLTSIFNLPVQAIAKNNGLVMARNGEFVSGGTLLRINDTGVRDIERRIPINYFQYAASGFPNVYSDVAGVHNMHNTKDVDRSIRHTWLLSLTAGLAVGAYPSKWTASQQHIFKKVINFHHTIVPYLYSTALEGYFNGYPTTLTPLSIAFPKDKKARNTTDFQFMIGESLLATPVLKNYKTLKRDIYLPKGVWYDYETNQKFDGPITLKNYEIPLDKTPVFVGGKGVLLERKNDQIYFKVYPIATKEKLVFSALDGISKYTLRIDQPNWETPKVLDKTSGKTVSFTLNKGCLVFPIEKEHEYLIY